MNSLEQFSFDVRNDKPYALNKFTNADMAYRLCSYILDYNSDVCDVTYGYGRFIQEIRKDKKRFRMVTVGDIRVSVLINNGLNAVSFDFNRLPFKPESFDCLLYDPPYLNSGDSKLYKNKSVAHDKHVMQQKDEEHITGHQLMDFARVLRRNGFLVFKDVKAYYNLPHFIFYDLFIQDIGHTPVTAGVKATKNYAFWNVFKKK